MFEIVPWVGGFSNLNCSCAHSQSCFCVILEPRSLAFSQIIRACSIVKFLVFAAVTLNSFNKLLIVAWDIFGISNSFCAHAAKCACFILGSARCFSKIRERLEGESFPFCGTFTTAVESIGAFGTAVEGNGAIGTAVEDTGAIGTEVEGTRAMRSWHCSDFEHQIRCPNPSTSFP